MPTIAPDLCNYLSIRKAARHISQFYDHRLAPAGLRTSQFSILARLRRGGPASINELAAAMVMDRTTMGRNLRPLERDGLIAIGTDPRDRRSRVLSVTPAGEARLDAARPLWAKAQREFEQRFGAGQAEALRLTLATLVATDLGIPE
jgi:DNA-binding MarR family transcriptional regulator